MVFISALLLMYMCMLCLLCPYSSQDVMDVYVLLDAITKCMSSEEKELCRMGEVTLSMVIETACTIVGERESSQIGSACCSNVCSGCGSMSISCCDYAPSEKQL